MAIPLASADENVDVGLQNRSIAHRADISNLYSSLRDYVGVLHSLNSTLNVIQHTSSNVNVRNLVPTLEQPLTDAKTYSDSAVNGLKWQLDHNFASSRSRAAQLLNQLSHALTSCNTFFRFFSAPGRNAQTIQVILGTRNFKSQLKNAASRLQTTLNTVDAVLSVYLNVPNGRAVGRADRDLKRTLTNLITKLN